jgi:hypothetical protein
MAYRRAKNLDKNLVFAEYFNSEQEVRRNGNYNGELDYIEVYNKALTAEEVSNLYNDARYVVPKLGA